MKIGIKLNAYPCPLEEQLLLMKKYGLDAPSRRTVSYNTSERHMREAFGGGRIPKWAERQESISSGDGK